MTNVMTVTEMTDRIVAETGSGLFRTSYIAPLSLDAKEVVTLMQLLDHASTIIKLDRRMNPASAEFFNRLTVMLFGSVAWIEQAVHCIAECRSIGAIRKHRACLLTRTIENHGR